MPSHFKGTEKKFKCVVFPVMICNTKFLHTLAEVCLYLVHKKMKQLRVFGAWHHSWKFWGHNHDIYSHIHYNLHIAQI
jgi:hypothetical protein